MTHCVFYTLYLSFPTLQCHAPVILSPPYKLSYICHPPPPSPTPTPTTGLIKTISRTKEGGAIISHNHQCNRYGTGGGGNVVRDQGPSTLADGEMCAPPPPTLTLTLTLPGRNERPAPLSHCIKTNKSKTSSEFFGRVQLLFVFTLKTLKNAASNNNSDLTWFKNDPQHWHSDIFIEGGGFLHPPPSHSRGMQHTPLSQNRDLLVTNLQTNFLSSLSTQAVAQWTGVCLSWLTSSVP